MDNEAVVGYRSARFDDGAGLDHAVATYMGTFFDEDVSPNGGVAADRCVLARPGRLCARILCALPQRSRGLSDDGELTKGDIRLDANARVDNVVLGSHYDANPLRTIPVEPPAVVCNARSHPSTNCVH